MRKLFLAVLLGAGINSFSQECTDFYYMQNNKTIEMTIANKKGKEVGKVVYTVSDVKKSGETVTSTVTSVMINDKGETGSKATNVIKCVGGIIMMDMKMFIPSAQQEQMGDVSATGQVSFLEYPSNMKEGDVLKDGQFSMDFKSQGGIGAHISIDITKRKVEGKESVTTPAGTWDCFKITYHSKMVIKIGIGLPVNTDITEWYAAGFGVVKTESKSGSTEITAIK
ncbi:MAG: hypothetical protein IT214_01105 [Chitinophagaceae bacterium]|jgi:hypothetical protein|nr:hypothetical protein [Chitinophagaceae bacterium]OQY94612.1 MAG: hypothetical protein B6D37_08040 [Sphingobacteriales bacterium UTBCD1]